MTVLFFTGPKKKPGRGKPRARRKRSREEVAARAQERLARKKYHKAMQDAFALRACLSYLKDVQTPIDEIERRLALVGCEPGILGQIADEVSALSVRIAMRPMNDNQLEAP